MTPEQEQDFGRIGRFVHKAANIKLSSLLALALVITGIGLVSLVVVVGIAEVNVSNQRGDITELHHQNDTLNTKLTNVGVRLNELQDQIDQLRAGSR